METRVYSDEFGDRMKMYEAVETARTLDPALPIYARVDGRSFSNFTRAMRRPFDDRMTAAMVGVVKYLVGATHARIGYTQSDEISIVWLSEEDAQPLFGGKVHKLTSVLASMAAASMQYEIRQAFDDNDASILCEALPHFDCRVFSLPSKVEAANAFLWRAMDARKNAVSMAARSVYSSKEMHGKDQSEMRAMMAQKGIVFEDYPLAFREGTWVRRVTVEKPLGNYELARIPEKHRPAPGSRVTRSEVRSFHIPEFHRVANRSEVIFDSAEPAYTPLTNINK